MIILHCAARSLWESAQNRPCLFEEMLGREGFIHCSSVEYFWRVASNFRDAAEELVLLCIDTDLLRAEVRWEDADGCGREYPHVYGPIDRQAITAALPFLRDENGTWVKNPELAHIPDR